MRNLERRRETADPALRLIVDLASKLDRHAPPTVLAAISCRAQQIVLGVRARDSYRVSKDRCRAAATQAHAATEREMVPEDKSANPTAPSATRTRRKEQTTLRCETSRRRKELQVRAASDQIAHRRRNPICD